MQISNHKMTILSKNDDSGNFFEGLTGKKSLFWFALPLQNNAVLRKEPLENFWSWWIRIGYRRIAPQRGLIENFVYLTASFLGCSGGELSTKCLESNVNIYANDDCWMKNHYDRHLPFLSLLMLVKMVRTSEFSCQLLKDYSGTHYSADTFYETSL